MKANLDDIKALSNSDPEVYCPDVSQAATRFIEFLESSFFTRSLEIKISVGLEDDEELDVADKLYIEQLISDIPISLYSALNQQGLNFNE